MSDLVWTENTRPDRPGIWMRKGINRPYTFTAAVDAPGYDDSWCFICDLPEIKDPPKWREVTAADVGREDVEFSDDERTWDRGQLRAVSPLSDAGNKYYSLGCGWKFARVVDDGEPAKQPLIFNLAIGDSCEMGGEEFRLTGRTKHTEVDAAGNRERVCTLRFVRELPAS